MIRLEDIREASERLRGVAHRTPLTTSRTLDERVGALIIPFVTVSLSAWLDQEQVGLELVAGGLLIIAGVYMGALRRARPATG